MTNENEDGPLLPQYKKEQNNEFDKEINENVPIINPSKRRARWRSPKSKNMIVAAGCLFILPIICLLSPLFALDTLVPHSPGQVHAPVHSYTLTSALPYAGSPTADSRPWPTDDKFPQSYFRTNLGDVGPTATGVEAAVAVTAAAYPLETALNPGIVRPTAKDARNPDDFDILRHVGHLTPYTSSPNYLPTTPIPPETCEVEQIHMIHRHGSRYPTVDSKPYKFSQRLNTAIKANANSKTTIGFKDDLAFLNEWNYPLGHEILTPIGRQQLYNSGASLRTKYGYLLRGLTHKPVFRTTTQDRMLKSSINFLAGFFGAESWQDESHLSVLHESRHYNNTLAPWENCPRDDPDRSRKHRNKWKSIYLADAVKRLNKQAINYEFTVDDAATMQELCAYETVSLGYSRFCGLFTKDEWKGFDYLWDLTFYIDAGFGSPTSRAQGKGWVTELLARIQKRTPAPYDSTTNSTLDENEYTFPLDQNLYVDFSHDTVIANIVSTLNLTQFSSHLPNNKIPRESKHITRWHTSHIAPFAGNIVVQVVNCEGKNENDNVKDEDKWEITKINKVPPKGKYARLVLNDAVQSLEGLNGCPFEDDGLCPLDKFENALEEIRNELDFDSVCHGKYSN